MKGALWSFFLLTNKMMCTFSVFHRNTLCLWGLTNILNAFPLQSCIFFQKILWIPHCFIPISYLGAFFLLVFVGALLRYGTLSQPTVDQRNNQVHVHLHLPAQYKTIQGPISKHYSNSAPDGLKKKNPQNTFNIVLLTHYTKRRWIYPINYVCGQLICNDGSRNITV